MPTQSPDARDRILAMLTVSRESRGHGDIAISLRLAPDRVVSELNNLKKLKLVKFAKRRWGTTAAGKRVARDLGLV